MGFLVCGLGHERLERHDPTLGQSIHVKEGDSVLVYWLFSVHKIPSSKSSQIFILNIVLSFEKSLHL